MIIEPGITKYLKGEELSTGLRIPIRRDKHPMLSREALIVDIIRNKSVLHIGCSDHIQIIDEKIKNGNWLHKLITDNASHCIGIDIDKPSIEYIRGRLGYNNVYHGDITADIIKPVTERKWDYVIFGEIVEHLDNPVNFLKAFREKYGDYISKFIITVPNIYNLQDYRAMLRYNENINTDHRFSFTPYTINKVIYSAGYMPEQVFYANIISLNFRELVIRKLKKIFKMPLGYPFYYFNSIIVAGSIKQ